MRPAAQQGLPRRARIRPWGDRGSPPGAELDVHVGVRLGFSGPCTRIEDARRLVLEVPLVVVEGALRVGVEDGGRLVGVVVIVEVAGALRVEVSVRVEVVLLDQLCVGDLEDFVVESVRISLRHELGRAGVK